jgi:hypothetical protein
MRRTQLYLDEELWAALHARALLEEVTISELVRAAVREQYLGSHAERRSAMLGIAGLWKDRPDVGDAESMIRNLRDDDRLKRLGLGRLEAE